MVTTTRITHEEEKYKGRADESIVSCAVQNCGHFWTCTLIPIEVAATILKDWYGIIIIQRLEVEVAVVDLQPHVPTATTSFTESR